MPDKPQILERILMNFFREVWHDPRTISLEFVGDLESCGFWIVEHSLPLGDSV